ncbi:MAG: DUF4197 domain-containing protein [bacterium]|nr:DUF4197 domain-containing protein [bacterium]MDT8366469.1 DUF4197 domain-containing protein [bacterium]
MKRCVYLLLPVFFLLTTPQHSFAGFFDDLIKQVTKPRESKEDTFIAGLKEALDIGTKNAVSKVSTENGYLDNLNIKIPVPEKLEDVEKLLRKIGMDDRVDEFVLSMNRAAEKAAPQAVDIFVGAIRDMTVVDAYGIVKGDERAATSYFQGKTTDNLYGLFRPVVTESMAQVGVVQSYKRMMDKYNSIPFVKKIHVDLEDYVTDEALGGLFFMVGEEEKKIRKDPAARVTKLLEEVFGN